MTARFLRTLAPVAVATAVCGVVAGCGGGSSEAKSSPPSSTTTTTSPSTSKPPATSATPTSRASKATYAGAPGVPGAAKHKTDAGAIAFAKYYLETVNMVGQKPATGVLDPLIISACKTCKRQQETVSTLIKKQARYTGSQMAIRNAQRIPQPGHLIIQVDIDQLAVQAVDAKGLVLRSVDAKGPAALAVFLRWADGWRVSEIQSAAS